MPRSTLPALRISLVAALLASGAPAALAQATDAKPAAPTTLAGAFAQAKPILDLRVRYEGVEQDGFANEADAVTARIRAGFETPAWNNTSFLIDFDFIEDLSGDFNSTTNGQGAYPVVPDPNVAELNRLQITNTSLPGTKVVLGRQRIIMDDARFVGNVGWRQNEQTFDALRFTNTSFGKLVVDGAYVARINRIFGDESAQGVWTGDTYLLNVSHPSPIGKLTGFAYLVDVDQAGGANAAQTYGARLTGEQKLGGGALKYTLSAATQTDWGSSNLDYEAPYYLASLDYAVGKFAFGAGYEVLGGDTARGFQTPLATLHAFQGWADKFLSTPNAGVEDLYASAAFTVGDVGPLKGLRLSGVYHDYAAESGSAHYGDEINLLATATVGKLRLGLKYADYNADTFTTDTSKVWFQIEYAL